MVFDYGKGTKVKQISSTGVTHDGGHTWSVEIINGVLNVKIGYGGSERTLQEELSDLGLPE